MTAPLSLYAYRLLTALGTPLAGPFLSMRLKRGKEDPRRIGERRGRPGLARPAGRLVWLHGGERRRSRFAAALRRANREGGRERS